MNVNWFSLILAFATVTLIAGVFLVSYNSLITVIEVIVHLWRRVFVTWAARRVRQLGIVHERPWESKAELDLTRLILIAAIPVLGVLVWDVMLSPLVLGIGLLLVFGMDWRKRTSERDQINEDAEMVALQLRSQMRGEHSLLAALQGVELPVGQMKHYLNEVTSRLEMHQPPEQAALALASLPGTATARLMALVANNAKTTDDVQNSLLMNLEQEAHRQKSLRARMRQTLALVRGTIRLLQGVVGGAVLFVLLVHDWRIFFLQDMAHRTLLTVLITGVVLASLYFEFEVYQLGRGEAF
jgi:hypothetical protein